MLPKKTAATGVRRAALSAAVALLLLSASNAQAQLNASSTDAAPAAQPPASPPTTTPAALMEELEFLRLNVLAFWARFGLDSESGGIHGTLNRSGAPVSPTAKGLVQQTRAIWAFSTHYMQRSNLSSAANTPGVASVLQALDPTTSSSSSSSSSLNSTEQLAQSAYDFVVQHMQDGNNSLWHWNVTRNGSRPIQRNKVITGQLFVLIGFSQYFAAFGDPTAKDHALSTFRVMDDAWHTPAYGGFAETAANGFPPDVPPTGRNTTAASDSNSNSDSTDPDDADTAAVLDAVNSTIPGSTGEVVSANPSTRPDAAGSQGLNATGNETRSLNVLMHGTEALADLHKATNDTQVAQRLLELLDIICNRLQRDSSGLLYSSYTPASEGGVWTNAPGSDINYGANLEIAWLVPDTLDYLLTINATDPQTHTKCTTAALAGGAAAVRKAHDPKHGGFCELRSADGNVSRSKVWWVQADAMLALYKLHKLRAGSGGGSLDAANRGAGLQPDYLALLVETVRFVRQYQTDNQVAGEQFWQVLPNGTFVETGDLDKDTKGNRWKAAYHTTQAPLYLQKWFAADQQQ